MSDKEANAPVPFSVMNGDGEPLTVKDTDYTVLPMEIGDAIKFIDDKVIIDAQIFNLASKKSREKIDGYLSKYCTNEKGEAMSLDAAIAKGWNIVHLKKFIKKLCDISG